MRHSNQEHVSINDDPCFNFFRNAKELAQCLYEFPYQAPSDVPLSVQVDKELMSIIAETHLTTIGDDGKTQQTTITAAERIRLQAEFKTRIYAFLEKCLTEDPAHGPALLLYPKVAEYNTRAADREPLIALHERFLPSVDSICKGTRAYILIENEIAGIYGNCFEKVERHLADFHYDLAILYMKTDQARRAKIEYAKSKKLCPQVYGSGPNRIKLL